MNVTLSLQECNSLTLLVLAHWLAACGQGTRDSDEGTLNTSRATPAQIDALHEAGEAPPGGRLPFPA